MERKPRTSAKLRKMQKRSKVIRKQLKYRIPQPKATTQRLRTESKQIIELIRIQVHTENLQSRNRVKTLLSQKGVRAQKLFWNLVNRKPKKKNTLEALELQAGLTSDQDQMNAGIESFFEIKFNTSFNPDDIQKNPVNLDEIGIPEKKFSQEAADEMMRPITLDELNQNIKELNIDKAEGLDGVTNNMLKHSGTSARNHLLMMFNNVIVGGQTPDSWKEGDVILVLKKPPQTDINNYRPITLISCISKLLTKILAKRLGEAIKKEDIIGPEQNGFRSSRTCSDNIFILNSILEINKNKKMLSHLLFIDPVKPRSSRH